MLVVGAAAAVLSVNWTADAPREPIAQASEDAAIEATPRGANFTLEAPGGSSSSEAVPPVAVATAAASGGDGAGPSGFTVALSFVHGTAHPDVTAATERIYAALREELRAVPGLILIELERPIGNPEPALTSVGFAPPVQLDAAQFFSRDFETAIGIAADDGGPTFVIVSPDADLARATAVVIDGEAETSDAGVASAYDFVLDATTSARMNAASTSPETYSFTVSGSRSGNASDQVTVAFSRGIYDNVDTVGFAKQTVEQLRKLLFEPDDVLIEQLQSVVVDPTAALAARLKALGELEIIANRSGKDGRTGAVVPAVLEMAARAPGAGERVQVWRAMAGADDPRLVGPLVDALLYDTAEVVRFEAAALLETFASDPTAQATLALAGRFDDATTVRKRATWSSLSAQGRRDSIAAALLDTSLSDEDRVEPLLYGVHAPGSPFSRAPQVSLLDHGAAATALVGILERSSDPGFMAPLLMHLGALDQPDVVAFLVDNVKSDRAEVVRIMSAEALRGHVEEPAVRAALENARANDTSPEVRRVAARALDEA